MPKAISNKRRSPKDLPRYPKNDPAVNSFVFHGRFAMEQAKNGKCGSALVDLLTMAEESTKFPFDDPHIEDKYDFEDMVIKGFKEACIIPSKSRK